MALRLLRKQEQLVKETPPPPCRIPYLPPLEYMGKKKILQGVGREELLRKLGQECGSSCDGRLRHLFSVFASHWDTGDLGGRGRGRDSCTVEQGEIKTRNGLNSPL